MRCMDSKTRDSISGKEMESGHTWCSRCGARVKIRVHKMSHGGYEGTMAVHEEAPRKAPVVSHPNEVPPPRDMDYEDMVMASIMEEYK